MNQSINFYVSPSGDDKNDGSPARPFQTVSRAVLAAKSVVVNAAGRAINLCFRGGIYRLPRPVEWTADEGPSGPESVTFLAFKGEEAVFSGAVEFGRLDWKPLGGGIMVSHPGIGYDFDVLYADSQRQIMARYPNLSDPETLFGLSAPAAEVLDPERIRRTWKTMPEDGYVRALHEKKWGGCSYRIAGTDSSGHVNLQWVGDNNRGSGYDGSQMIVENVREELDAPNEWYYDRKTGDLFFYPPEGMDLENSVFEGASASELIRLIGNGPDEPVQNISFVGIHFTKTHRTLFNSPYERPLRGDWGFARTGALFLTNARNITVKGCVFDEIGGNAIMMSGYNEAHRITGNRMTQIGASAVLIAGKENAVREPSHWDHDDHKTGIQDRTPGPKSEDYPRRITVEYNCMYDMGLYEKQVSGVCMSISSHIHVKGNTIHRCPRAGININDGTFGGHLIEDNDIFDCVRGTSDHGPINTWGRDRFWSLGGYDISGGGGEEKAPYAFLDAVETTVIRHNRIAHDGDYGVDLDDGSSNYVICDNLFLGTGVKLREGFRRIVRNNIIIGGAVNIHVSYAENRDAVEHNIILSAEPYHFISPNAGSKTLFCKNLFYFDGRAIDVKSDGLSEDRDYIIADPLFLCPQMQDYTVTDGSPALQLGFCRFNPKSFGVRSHLIPCSSL